MSRVTEHGPREKWTKGMREEGKEAAAGGAWGGDGSGGRGGGRARRLRQPKPGAARPA